LSFPADACSIHVQRTTPLKKTGPENDYIGVRLLGSSVKSTVGMGQFNRMARNSNSGLTQAQHDPKQSAEAGADGVVSEF
jgi:hypothetical protein